MPEAKREEEPKAEREAEPESQREAEPESQREAGPEAKREAQHEAKRLSPLQFLKLGGSLITDKDRPHTPQLETLNRLAQEIYQARQLDPGLKLVLGHGSGSFGHTPAHRYGTRQGVSTLGEWQGFIEVWQEAAALNHLVMAALSQAGVPAIAFPPSASVTARSRQVESWDLSPLLAALQAGLLPVIYGDVVFDRQLGGTILSTEDLFSHLAGRLHPNRLLLATVEPGVWADYPACTRLVAEITPASLPGLTAVLSGSSSIDVTGGMASKVSAMLGLVEQNPGLEVLIFSGLEPGQLLRLLHGESAGTRLHA
jgi:isopentenyl phosphate kinase